MANFKDSPHFKIENQYYTPAWVWKKIKHLVNPNSIIWEACMLNAEASNSIQIWKDWGYKVVGNTSWDILNCKIPECDIIITNIPFETTLKIKILQRLYEIGIPFIIIMNSCNIYANYFHEICDHKNTQIIIPKGKLHYQLNGEKEKLNTSFYSVFVAYKMDLSNNDLFVF